MACTERLNMRPLVRRRFKRFDFIRTIKKLRSKINLLKNENNKLKNKLEKIHSHQSHHHILSKSCSFESHENISSDFREHNHCVEYKLQKELKNMDRIDIWKVFCKIYQTSFSQCREKIHFHFTKQFDSLTELSKKEEESRQTDWERQCALERVGLAYQFLLQHCIPKLEEKERQSIAEKVMASSNVDKKISNDVLKEQALKAVDICWRMQTVSPPMFLCQPKLFSEDWHTIHRNSWYGKEDELVYYRPVLMYSAGGTVAHKGFVGNKPQAVDLDIKLKLQPTAITTELNDTNTTQDTSKQPVPATDTTQDTSKQLVLALEQTPATDTTRNTNESAVEKAATTSEIIKNCDNTIIVECQLYLPQKDATEIGLYSR